MVSTAARDSRDLRPRQAVPRAGEDGTIDPAGPVRAVLA